MIHVSVSRTLEVNRNASVLLIYLVRFSCQGSRWEDCGDRKSAGFMHYVEEADTTFSHRRPIHHAGLDPPKAGGG